MVRFNRYFTLFFFSILLAFVVLPSLAEPPASFGAVSALTPERTSLSESKPRDVASNSTFYIARPDMRKCASPLCGGYFIRRVNNSLTRCANGRYLSECYVTSIDWNGMTEVEISRALLRGTILTKGNRNGRYGVLKVSQVWLAPDDHKPAGDFYRVRDLGIRCIAAPCLSHLEGKLNTTLERKIAGVALNEGGEQAQTAMTSTTGIIVAGVHSPVTGPAGRSEMLKASQFYVRQDRSVGMKPCIKTGCSGQICADHEVVSTCEYRPEYECYKKATCERQANGDCGFTKTKELTNCLARVR